MAARARRAGTCTGSRPRGRAASADWTTFVSETAERSPGLAGTPPGGPATGRNDALGVLRRLGVLLLRQREVTVFVVAAALFLYFALNPGSSSAFVSRANLVTLFSNPSNAA